MGTKCLVVSILILLQDLNKRRDSDSDRSAAGLVYSPVEAARNHCRNEPMLGLVLEKTN